VYARIIVGLSLGFLLSPLMLGVAEEKVPSREVIFPSPDGGLVSADLYGSGKHGVVLAHGRIFDKSTWRPLAIRLAQEGLVALPIDFRGYGATKAGGEQGALYNDVLAAIRYLHGAGFEEVSVIGASMGGGAAARAAIESKAGEIDRLILLSPVPVEDPETMVVGALFYIVSDGERLAASVKDQYERAPEPKRLEILRGDAHAQHIFKTDLADDLTDLIVEFLLADQF